ncbi:MAG: hypothetical protein IJ572_04445 [Bacilli bacterium]|nr:hypothetical protein [Bacilli bacterium]
MNNIVYYKNDYLEFDKANYYVQYALESIADFNNTYISYYFFNNNIIKFKVEDDYYSFKRETILDQVTYLNLLKYGIKLKEEIDVDINLCLQENKLLFKIAYSKILKRKK